MSVRQQHAGELREAAQSVSFDPLLRNNVDTFEIRRLGRLGDDVGLEDQLLTLDPDPNPAFVNTAGCAFTKSVRIASERIYSTFVTSHRGVNSDDHFQVGERCSPQTGDRFSGG